ncbi:hypothetical protein A3762_15100 [Oleiphilus sp. HI0125]|uniref:polysaccharide pyruvyl transferase family protein n=1 Tax=Oleiphilus sp. HI0125 TaxID=1822266 RepID=UPI0007C39212|nr:polysaccharide pyruvyl transferase family protein [Oleiphilus sp. HI0125]KZZ60855.1 hypothetical protein A3762_15100 [Oleiphilus sp. HI0125]
MRIEYCKVEDLNFGDDLNVWLWPKLIPECLVVKDKTALLGIGTILNQRTFDTKLAGVEKAFIFGSGCAGEQPIIPDHWRVLCVRGPKTAEAVGLDSTLAVADPAYLLRAVEMSEVEKQYSIGFMPHHRSERDLDWKRVCDAAGIRFVSAKQPVEDAVREIRSCDLLLTEAMHGAIVADAFRVPWVPVFYNPTVSHFKWQDFAASMQIDLKPVYLPFICERGRDMGRLFERKLKGGAARFGLGPKKWMSYPVPVRYVKDSDYKLLGDKLLTIAKTERSTLSSDDAVETATSSLLEKVAQLKGDYLGQK